MKTTTNQIKETIIKINQTKQLVLDFYRLAGVVETLDENAEYLYQCECKMDECGELIENLWGLLADMDIIDDIEQLEYLKNEFNFIPFDTSLIWDYLGEN